MLTHTHTHTYTTTSIHYSETTGEGWLGETHNHSKLFHTTYDKHLFVSHTVSPLSVGTPPPLCLTLD